MDGGHVHSYVESTIRSGNISYSSKTICVCVCVSGVTESLFYSGGGGGGGVGLEPDLRLGGLEDGIAMISPITFIVHNQKSNGGGGGGMV